MLRLYLFIFLASVHGFDTGRVEVNVEKDQISRQEIVFADPFWSVPRVAIHLLGEHEQSIYAQIENVSLIGFTLSVISDEDAKLEFEFFGTDDADTQIECVSGIDRVIQLPIINENAKIAVLSTQGKRNLIEMEYIQKLLTIKAEGEFGFCLIIGEPFGGLFFQSLHSNKAISLVQEMTKTNRGLEILTHNNPSLEINQIPHLSLQIEKDNAISLQVEKQSPSSEVSEIVPQLSLEVEKDVVKQQSLEIENSEDNQNKSNDNLEELKASIRSGIKDTIKKMELEVEQDEIRALNAKVKIANQELKEEPQLNEAVKAEVEQDLHRTIQSMRKEIQTLEDQKVQSLNQDLKQKINNLKSNIKEHKFISQDPNLSDEIQPEELNTASENLSIEDIKDTVEQSDIQEEVIEQNQIQQDDVIVPQIVDDQQQESIHSKDNNSHLSFEVDREEAQQNDSELKDQVESNLKQTIRQMNQEINQANAKQQEQKNVNALKNSIKQTMSKLAPIKNNSKKTQEKADDQQVLSTEEVKQDEIEQQGNDQQTNEQQVNVQQNTEQQVNEQQITEQQQDNEGQVNKQNVVEDSQPQIIEQSQPKTSISLKVDSDQKISEIGDQVKQSIKSTISKMKEEIDELEDEKSSELVKELKQNIKMSVDKLSHLPAKKQKQIVQEVTDNLDIPLEVDHQNAPKESLEVETAQEAATADEESLEKIEKEIIATENEVNPEQLNIEKAQVTQSIKHTINQMRQEIQELEDQKVQHEIEGIKSNIKESLKRMSQPSTNVVKKVMKDTIQKIEDTIPSHQLIAHDSGDLNEDQLDDIQQNEVEENTQDQYKIEVAYVAQQEKQIEEEQAEQQEIYQEQQEAIVVEEQQDIEEQLEVDMEVAHQMEQEALERLADDTVDLEDFKYDNQNVEQVPELTQDQEAIRYQELEIEQQNQIEEEQKAEYQAEQLEVITEQAEMEEERKIIEYNQKQSMSEEKTKQYLEEEQQLEEINEDIQQQNNAQLEQQQEEQIRIAEDLEAEKVINIGSQNQQSDELQEKTITHQESLLVDDLEDSQLQHEASLLVDDQNIVEESLIVEDLSDNHEVQASLEVDDLAVDNLKEQIISDVQDAIEELNVDDIVEVDSTVNGQEILLIGDDDSSEQITEQQTQNQQLEDIIPEVIDTQAKDQDFIESEIVAVANSEEVVDLSAFNVEEMDNEAPPIETRATTDSIVDITDQELDIMQEDANQQVEEVHYNIAQQINDPHSMIVEIVDDVAYDTITDLNNQEDLEQSDDQAQIETYELNDEPMNEQLVTDPQLEDLEQDLEQEDQQQLVTENENFENDDQYVNEDQYYNDELNYDDIEDDQQLEDQLQEDQFSQEQTLNDQLQEDMELDNQEDNFEDAFQQQGDDQIQNDNEIQQNNLDLQQEENDNEIQQADIDLQQEENANEIHEHSLEIEQQQIVDDSQNIDLQDELFNADVNLDVTGFGEPIGQLYEDFEKGLANVDGFGEVIDDLEWVEAVPELDHDHTEHAEHIPELDSNENAIQEVIASWAEQDVQQELLDEPPQSVESHQVVEPLKQEIIPQINETPTVSKIESEIRQMLKMEDFKKVSDDTLKERLSDEEKYKEEYRKFQEDQKKRQETHDLDTNDRLNQKQINAMENYDVEHEQRKQEIYEQIKTELESKGRIKVSKQTNDRYDLEEAFTNWQRNIGQDIIPSILSHSVTSEQKDIVLGSPQKEERVSKFQEVQIEVEKALGEKAKRKLDPRQKSEMRGQMDNILELRLEDLKYIKDDPLLDDVYSSFLSVNQKVKNLRGQ